MEEGGKRKKRGKGKGGDVEDPGTKVKIEAHTPEARKGPLAEMTDDDDNEGPLDAQQLKRMMGVLNDQTTREGVCAEKKKKISGFIYVEL